MAKRKDLLDVPMTIEWNQKSNRKYFLKHLIESNGYTSMAEIGVRDGRTTFYLLDNIANLTIYGIDLDTTLFYNDKVNEKYKDRLIPIRGKSANVAIQVPMVDLVFIDADHSYNGCLRDIIEYTPKVNKGGILSGHDIDFPGVNKAVNQLVKYYDVGPNNVWFTKT
jgi:predicted O-methyltransferase YrrM|tara:strand:- start:140 stop:637 length:498 start_codon:yes stop_codon:yes gene_type:complete